VDSIDTRYYGEGNEITGVTEPLTVLAIAVNKISYEAKSALYPQDIIHYDWDPANWMGDLSFSDGETPGGATQIITGFKGVIYFRHDTLLDNYCGYDFRNCKFRRWKTDAIPWNELTTYAKGDKCIDSGIIYYSLVDSNLNNLVSDTTKWLAIIKTSLSEYWYPYPQGEAAYADLLTFNPAITSYEESCYGNHIEGCKYNSFMDSSKYTLLGNNVFHLSNDNAPTTNNSIQQGFYCNTVGYGFRSNIIGSSFMLNIIGNDFLTNTVGNSNINNIFGEYFAGNYIGEMFGINVVGDNFMLNTIGSGFSFNTIRSGFNYNTVEDSPNYATSIGIDFAAATHVYAAYTCTIYIRPDGTAKLRYYNDSDALTVVAANA
jgi:hypothetical protein